GYSAVGYGYGEGDQGGVQRTIRDYLLILRERIWYIVVVFLVVFSSSIVYTFSQTKIYQAVTTVQIFRRDQAIMNNVTQVMDTDIRGAEDVNTQIKILESDAIVKAVADKITGEELRLFLAPYERSSADPAFVSNTLRANRRILQQRLTLVVNIAYQHPNPAIAASVANHFADAYLEYNRNLRLTEATKAVEELKTTIDDQRKQVEKLANDLQAYKEQRNMVSLD